MPFNTNEACSLVTASSNHVVRLSIELLWWGICGTIKEKLIPVWKETFPGYPDVEKILVKFAVS